MIKRRFSALVLALAAALVLSACGAGTPSGDPDAQVLTLMGKKSDLEKSYMTRVI